MEEAVPLAKLQANIAAAKKNHQAGQPPRFVVLLSTGSFAPVHKMHYHIFEVAKEWLETRHGFTVVGGWMSPSHDNYVLNKLACANSPPINAEHRVAMCRAVTAQSSWVDVSAWEATHPDGFQDFPDVMQFHDCLLREYFTGGEDITLMYLGGADLIERCGPVFGLELEEDRLAPVVAVGRPGYTEALHRMVEAERRFVARQGWDVPECREGEELLYIVTNETLDFSSTKVRERLERNESVADLCGEEVEAYLQKHDLHQAFLRKPTCA